MKIAKKIIVFYILFMLLVSNFLQAQCTCTESSGSFNANQLALCENFESYSNGSAFPFNNSRWTFWPGTGTLARIQTTPNSNNKALYLQNNGGSAPDLLLKLGNRTTGRYRISWQMFIPKGKIAYYNFQHAETAERWAFQVTFEANGIGSISRLSQPPSNFAFITGGWNKVMHIVDLNTNQMELWINDEFIDSWEYSWGEGPNFTYFDEKTLAAVNFYAPANSAYYVDNICMWQGSPTLINNTDKVCVKNGQSYTDIENIAKKYGLYTKNEFSNEKCLNICSFAGLNIKNSLKFDNETRVPASKITAESILPNQVINLPCLKDLFPFLTRKQLRGQIYPFTATSTDLSIDLQFQTGSKSDVSIALLECNEALNFPCILDQNSDGSNYYFNVVPGKTYNIIILAIKDVEFLIDISTVVGPKICKFSNEDLDASCICKDSKTTLNQPTILTNAKTEPLSTTKRVFPEINKDYLGGEKAFRITLDLPSLVNFTLSSANQGYSMFLAGSDCTDNLLALNSTPDNGGTATISKALEAGVYHLVVDQLRVNSNSTFQLTYAFSVLDPVSRVSNSSCPTNPNNVHQVSIRSNPLLLNTDVLTIKDRIYLVNTRNSNNREANAINWNGQEINFTLQEDASFDNLNCGYVEGDLIEFVIIRQDKIYSVKPIFQLENGTDITASNQFKKGGKSLITAFVSNLNISNLGVSSIPSLTANERIFDVEVNSTGAWRIQRVNPNKPAWIEFNLTSSSGIKDVSFKVLRNQSTQSRTDTVLVINDQGFYKSIVITQPGCTGPSVNAGQDQSICAGQNVNLTASGNGTITWESPGAISNPRLSTTLNATQTFTAYATINGCSATDQITVNVSPKPNANAGPDQTICSGSKALLSASGGGTYAWSNGSTALQFEVNPTVTTTYTLTVTSQLGCTATDQVVVVVNRATASAGSDRSICRGDSTTLQASGGGTYLWSNGKTSPSITVSPTSDQVYQVTVSNNNCPATATVKVSVNSLPLANAGADTSICSGSKISLTASGVGTYKWSVGETTAKLEVNPSATTTYTLTVTSQSGCTATDQVVVVVNRTSASAGTDRSSICRGDSTTLQASGGGTYLWSNGKTSPSITVSPTSDQVYQVTVSNNNCPATATVKVSVNPLPLANAGADTSICAGSKAFLSASGGGTYTWSNGSTATKLEVNPSATTTYTLTVTSQSGCTATDQVVVVVNRTSASAGTDRSSICRGDSTTLQASGGGTYLWSNGKTSPSITVSPTSDQVYQVTVSNNNCPATATVKVSVNPLPLANAGADTSICAGSKAFLSASGGGTYTWSNGSTATKSEVNPTTTTTYTLTVTSQSGCTATDQVVVVVNRTSASAGTDRSSICRGDSTTLQASGGGTYLWSNGKTSPSITVSPTSDQVYQVTVSNNNCPATATVKVSVNPLPLANAGADTSICAGQSVMLTASGGSTYKWSNNTNFSSITVTPAGTETFTVTVTAQNGCEATDQLTVTVRPLPVANAGPDQSICAGQSALLTASGGGTYKWNTNATASSITVVPGATETYTVTVTQNGCEATDQLTVTVRPLPIANAGPDKSICAGQSALLTASGGGTYKWNTNATASSITVVPGITETYTVTVTQDGCEATDQLTVTVRPLPIANAGPDQSICAGQSAMLTASGGSTYKWNTNATASSITIIPGASETYTVTVTQDGCEATDQLTVTVRSLPIANAGPDQSICAGQSALLTATGGGTYKWNTNATASSITVVPGITETYTVTVTQDGCEATDQLTVTVRPLPIANAGPDQSICAGQSALLTATGGSNYKWNTNTTASSITVVPGSTEIYTVTVTQDGCEATDQLTVTVRSLPIANAGPDQSICAGQSALLTATGGGTYKWNTNATASSITVVPGASETYTVTVTQNGCEAADQLTVAVRPLPIANAGPDLSICAKQSAVLNATGGNTYKWSNNATTASITISPQATQVFTVTVTQNECESVDEVRVTVRLLPNANAGPDQSICVGQSTVLNASGGGTYKWSTNATTFNISVSPVATQIYTLTVTQNDCEAIDQVSITVNPNPSIKKDSSQFKAGPNSFIAISVTGGKAPYLYQWFRNDTLVSTQEDLVGLKTGIYKLSIQDANGCSAGYGPELFIITSARDVAGVLDLKIYPNPTQGQVRIEGKLSKKETVQVRILEATGKYIWKSDIKTANEFLYTPDLFNLAKGIYIIQLDVSGELVYRKLVLQ